MYSDLVSMPLTENKRFLHSVYSLFTIVTVPHILFRVLLSSFQAICDYQFAHKILRSAAIRVLTPSGGS